jgi:CBS domain-containing protein
MVAAGVHRLVVVEGDRVVGILAARDVLEEVMARPIDDSLRSVMTTPVEAIGIGDTIATALARIASVRVHGLVVVDGMSPVGLFTHAEAIACQSLPLELRERPVEEVMSYEILCLDGSTKIRRAAAYASVMNARRMIVLEDKHLVGIVSSLDLVRALARSAN